MGNKQGVCHRVIFVTSIIIIITIFIGSLCRPLLALQVRLFRGEKIERSDA